MTSLGPTGVAIQAKIRWNIAAGRVIGEPERLVDWIEQGALVNAVVATHAIGVGRAVRSELWVVTTEARVLMDARRDRKRLFRVRSGRRLPRRSRVAIATRLRERAVPGERAALEIAEVAADAFFRRAGKYGGLTHMTLPARRQRVLPVERERMNETSPRPTVVVVATSALLRIKLLVQLLMQRFLRCFVVRLVTRRAVLGRDLDMYDFEILGTFAAERARDTREQERKK